MEGVVSDLGVFELDHTARLLRLMSIHPGVTVERIRQQTSGEVLIADPLPATVEPTSEQLRLIRHEIDPFGIRRLEFVPGKERLGMIESILNSEAALVNEISNHSG